MMMLMITEVKKTEYGNVEFKKIVRYRRYFFN